MTFTFSHSMKLLSLNFRVNRSDLVFGFSLCHCWSVYDGRTRVYAVAFVHRMLCDDVRLLRGALADVLLRNNAFQLVSKQACHVPYSRALYSLLFSVFNM